MLEKRYFSSYSKQANPHLPQTIQQLSLRHSNINHKVPPSRNRFLSKKSTRLLQSNNYQSPIENDAPRRVIEISKP